MGDLTKLGVYLSYLCKGLGHADRHSSLREYCSGLMLPIERKSIEPLAACAAPCQVGAKHQALHHFVAKSEVGRQIRTPTYAASPSCSF